MPNEYRVSRARGFTLIELLIVVAIIAILAAIAVPSLLEAQTRAKVSRTKTDMRTLATALESYYIDNNKYTPDHTDFVVFGLTRYEKQLNRQVPLTTPISYISSLPESIFSDLVATGQTTPDQSIHYSDASGNTLRPIVFDYAKYDRNVPVHDTPAVWNEISRNESVVQWALNSTGPKNDEYFFLGDSRLVIYDPTNGTVSRGNILRTSIGADDGPFD